MWSTLVENATISTWSVHPVEPAPGLEVGYSFCTIPQLGTTMPRRFWDLFQLPSPQKGGLSLPVFYFRLYESGLHAVHVVNDALVGPVTERKFVRMVFIVTLSSMRVDQFMSASDHGEDRLYQMVPISPPLGPYPCCAHHSYPVSIPGMEHR